MIDLQLAWENFFKQFTENVFLETNVIDPAGTLFPRITYSYASSDVFTNILVNFQIWSRSTSTNEALAIAGRIEQAIPAISGIILDIKGDIIYEFFNRAENQWEEFNIEDFNTIFQNHVDKFLQYEFEWRQTEGKKIGSLWLHRGTPFIQPRMTDESSLIAYYGNIDCRSHLLQEVYY